jgi:hypothetical protein
MPLGSRLVGGAIAIALATGFSGIGWWLWRSFVPTHPVAAYVYGIIVVAIGTSGLYLAVRNLIRPVPFAIRISDKGITAYRGRCPDLILWSDIKGAHAALEGGQRVSVPIIALELVDPRSFYARLNDGKPAWLGPDTGLRPKYYPLASTGLDMEPEQLLRAVNDSIRRWGTANPDPSPETNYIPMFTLLPGRAPFAIGLVLLVTLFTAPFALLSPPSWMAAAENCEVRNRYGGKQWRRAKTTSATWSGPCVEGRARGQGILEWFRDGRLTIRYSGQMEGGRITGRGELTEYGIRYEGTWKDGELREGVGTYPGGHRYSGKWDRGDWTRGVLTVPGGYRFEERWYRKQLTGKNIARGPQGQYEGNWTDGVPEGAGVFVTSDGRRFEGKWRKGKPVDLEVARLQDQERWDCLWDIISRRFDVGRLQCRNQ